MISLEKGIAHSFSFEHPEEVVIAILLAVRKAPPPPAGNGWKLQV